jgi:serine/threonine-protein kinase
MVQLYCAQGHENQIGSHFCIRCGQPLWLGVGHILEKRYRIVSQLATGGFGRTYLAENLHRFNERCVLKEFAPQVQGDVWRQAASRLRDLQKAKELFEREAGALHKLDHPQLPKFREFFQAELGEGVSCLFLAQDYVEGQTYCELLKSAKRLKEADVTGLICHLLPVLSYIHSQGVIHRDISPDNLILRSSDKLPVLIDFGGVKQVAATVVARFTQLGQIPTRLGKKGYAPEEQMLQGKVFASSDLYALAVTALVLLTGKEPLELYDSYKGSWLWRKEIKVSSQLETVLQKMLAYKPSDRYQSANEVLQALSQTTTPSTPNISQMRTINFVGQKPESKPSYSHQKGSTQVIAPPTPYLSWLRPWAVRIAGAGLVGFIGINALPLVNSMMRSIQLMPVQVRSPDTSHSSAEQIKKLLSRQQALKIKARFFNSLVDDSFHTKHPELQGRSLKPAPEDAALRSDWYNIADELLNKLEQAQLSTAARRKLGSYSQLDYEIWKEKVSLGQLGNYTIDQLREQTNQKFYQLFPQQRREKLNQKTFGQIWYAIAADKIRQKK